MQNYLELLDKLLISEIATETKTKNNKGGDDHEEEFKVLCGTNGKRIEFSLHVSTFIGRFSDWYLNQII